MSPDTLLFGTLAFEINISIDHIPDQSTIGDLRLDGFKDPPIGTLATNGQTIHFNGSHLILVHHFQEGRVINLFIFWTNVEILEHRQQYSCDNQPK